MAAFDQRDDRLVRVFLQHGDGRFGNGGGFVAVAQAIHNRHQRPMTERFDQVQIAGNILAGDRLRGDSPFDERFAIKQGSAHINAPIFASSPWSLCRLVI